MEGHVELITIAKVMPYILGPLVGFGEQHPVREVLVELLAEELQHRVGLRQVLTGRALTFDEVRHGVDAEPVHSEVEPELHHFPHFLTHYGVVVVQVGLMTEEPVPVVLLGLRIPGPVGSLGIDEDDADSGVAVVRIAPDVPVSPRVVAGAARFLEPCVLIGGVIEHQLGDHAQSACVGGVEKLGEVVECAVARVNTAVVRDVVAVVPKRRRVHGQKPQAIDAQVLEVVQLARQPLEVADAVSVAVGKGLDVQLIDHRILVPERIDGTRAWRGQAIHKPRSSLAPLVERVGCVIDSPRGVCAPVQLRLDPDARSSAPPKDNALRSGGRAPNKTPQPRRPPPQAVRAPTRCAPQTDRG